ncbi:hypothetical protein [Sulfitobacter sp. SK012]|nr:hypothetical protein [Sulfitobacter sp. SK012]
MLGSEPPCGDAATGSHLMFSDLPLGIFAVTYAKLFKALVFTGTKPR